MLVSAGHKQTEVGVLPDDWEVEVLGECVRSDAPICYGILMPGPPCSGGVPVIKVRDIVGGRILDNDLLLANPLIDDAYRRSRLRPNDILITIRGTTGRIAIVPDSLNNANITQDTARVRANGKHSYEYLYFALMSEPVQHQIALQTIGQAVKGINIRDIRQLAFAVPPTKAEQEAIAEALGDADALIDALEQLVAKKRQIKVGAMQELLTGKKRLPGFKGEWEPKRLGDCLLSQPAYGINAPAVPYLDRLPTYIRITDITEDGRFRPDPRVSVNSVFSDQYLLSDGDVVFARTGASVGKSYRYRTTDGPLVFAGFLIRVKPNPDTLLSEYLAAYVTTKPYWNWVRLMSMRSGQPGINGNEFGQFPIRLPSIDEQAAISAILLDMDEEIETLEAKLAKARQVKQGMMQELLTGRIRLV